jgi:hypothetical protein
VNLPLAEQAAAWNGATAPTRHRRRDHPRLGCQLERTKEKPKGEKPKEEATWDVPKEGKIRPAGVLPARSAAECHFFFDGPLAGGGSGSFSSG